MKTLSVISGIASILGLIIAIFCNKQGNLSWIEWMSLVILCLSSIYLWYDWYIHKPQSFDSDDKKNIDEYMLKLFSSRDSIFIFTINMSWAENPEIVEQLKFKAKQKQLTICLPKIIEKAKELKKDGARVIEYNYMNYIPQSRFTIIRYNTIGAKVSVGRTVGDIHNIEEYDNGKHIFFSLAMDMANMLTELDNIKRKKQFEKKRVTRNKSNPKRDNSSGIDNLNK